MPEHEILEMLLYFSRPRINTNEIAHRLINHFGSLNGVLDATPTELVSVEGIGVHSATLLKLVQNCGFRYAMGKTRCTVGKSLTMDEIADYFVQQLRFRSRECFMVMLFDGADRVIDSKILFEGVVNFTPMITRRVLEYACACNAVSICISHNHPGGRCLPSNDDIQSTLELRKLCSSVDMTLKDHILVANDSYCSVMEYILNQEY